MNYRNLDASFAVAGQILPAQLRNVADAGFKTIVCARPDNEEPGQPSFKCIAAEAEKLGLRAVQIPISGAITEAALVRMQTALNDLPKPMLGYCRSGARAGSLYGSARRALQ